jgi:hypothetical protein
MHFPGGASFGARGRLAFRHASRTVTAPPGRDTAIRRLRQQRQPKLQVGGVAYRCPIEFRHKVGMLGRPTCQLAMMAPAWAKLSVATAGSI